MRYVQGEEARQARQTVFADAGRSSARLISPAYGLEEWSGPRFVEGIESSTFTRHDASVPNEEHAKITLGHGETEPGAGTAVWVTTSTRAVDDNLWLFETRFATDLDGGGPPMLSADDPSLVTSQITVIVDGEPVQASGLTDGQRWVTEIHRGELWITLAVENLTPKQVRIAAVSDMGPYNEGSRELIDRALDSNGSADW